jgi:uncharacterized protein YfiM (DUF2279 family)
MLAGAPLTCTQYHASFTKKTSGRFNFSMNLAQCKQLTINAQQDKSWTLLYEDNYA